MPLWIAHSAYVCHLSLSITYIRLCWQTTIEENVFILNLTHLTPSSMAFTRTKNSCKTAILHSHIHSTTINHTSFPIYSFDCLSLGNSTPIDIFITLSVELYWQNYSQHKSAHDTYHIYILWVARSPSE